MTIRNYKAQGITGLIKASNPLIIFILIWIIIILFYSMGISYNIPNKISLLIVIALISFLCFSTAFYISHRYASTKYAAIDVSTAYEKLSIQKFRWFSLFALLGCLAIVIWNLYYSGYFPYMTAWGYKTANYKAYGHFKGILFPLLFLLFMVSSLEKKTAYEWIIKLFCLSIGWLYVSRSALTFMISQYIIFIIVTGKYRTIFRLMVIIIVASCFIFFEIGYLGKVRTGNKNFKCAMQIKKQYQQSPATLLWFVSYLSMPSVNLLQVVESSNQLLWGKMLLNSSLPAPLKTDGWRDYYDSLLPNRNNTVCTYLGYAFLDFSWAGVAIVNIIYGLIGGFLFGKLKHKVGLYYLINYSIYLSLLVLIFFSNMIFFFPLLFESITGALFTYLVTEKEIKNISGITNL